MTTGDVTHACANQLGTLQFVEAVCDDDVIVLTVDALPCWSVLCIEYGFSAAHFIQWLLVPIPSTAPFSIWFSYTVVDCMWMFSL